MLDKIIVPIAETIIKVGGKKAIVGGFFLAVGCIGIKGYEIYCNHSKEMYKEHNLHEEAMNGVSRQVC